MGHTPSVFERLVRRLRLAGAPVPQAPATQADEIPPATQADDAAPAAVYDHAARAALGDAETALADWRRYAASLEHELEGRSTAPVPAFRYSIAAAADGPAAVPRQFDFEFEAGTTGPRVTVIIPVYDAVEMTIDCLRSLAACAPTTVRAEYVVVDDASPSEAVRAFGAIAGLTVLRNGDNLGFLRSCNRAAQLSTADYLVFLNNDTIVRAGWLDELVATAERDARVGVVGAKLIYPNGTLQEAGGLIWRDASGWNYGKGGRADDPAYEYVRDVDYLSGAAMLVRRSLWNRLGGFDQRYAPAYFEDSDLCFSARRAGFRVVYQPRSVVIHLEGGTGGTDVAQGVKHNQVVNQPKFRRKWFDVLETQHAVNDPRSAQRAARRLQGSRIVVMIDNYVPEPDRDSGSNKIVHIIRILRELGWHVIYMPDNYHASQPYTNDLQQIGVEVLYHIDGGPPARERLDAALALADLVWIGRPDLFSKYRSWFADRPELPIVYDTHDLHYVRLARELELRGDAVTERDRQAQRDTEKLELDIARTVDVTLTVTEIEKRTLEARGIDGVHVVPNIHVARPRTIPYEETEGLLFIGGYSHPPNVDAAEWLVHEIMPTVWEDFPALRVTLLGSNAPASVWALARDPRVVVTGYVEDVTPYFEAARVFVSPLRYGAGLKGKIGQSLEYGLPVVTTSVGAEGFDFVDGRDALIADDADAFARAVKRLYADRLLWARMSDATRARLAPFLPNQVKERIAGVLGDAAKRRRSRRGEPAPV